MSGGYMGKILRIDLTAKSTSTINTADYEEYGGGHGMGSAIFFDLVKDKTIGGFDPKNVVTIMASPLSGTLAPSVAGRTEVQGIGVQGYPVEWFTRSNFGGRFSGHMKFAGWDGIVLEGKADKPVWIDIRNDKVEIRDAAGLWGLDTVETQEEIWRIVQSSPAGEWQSIGGSARDVGRSTQKPAVLTIGRAGENQSRTASLVHDSGNGAGQGGFGGVWGSKNLKAISVIGTGGVPIADPKALMDARLWSAQYATTGHFDDYDPKLSGASRFGSAFGGVASAPAGTTGAPMGCLGCIRLCRTRYEGGAGNASHCVDNLFYNSHDNNAHGGMPSSVILWAMDAMQRSGINAYMLEAGILWLVQLNKLGIMGPGKQIDTDLPFDQVGQKVFLEQLIDKWLNKKDIGAQLHEGLARAAVAWGRYEEDTKSGILPLQEWGYPQHYDARTEVEWGYGSLLGDRDCNEHDFNSISFWWPSRAALTNSEPYFSAQQMSEICADILTPYNDPMMIDYSDEGIYSESMAKLVAWHRHYTRYYKQSLAFCDWAWADIANAYGPDGRGITGQAEPKFFNAVTGKNQTFEEGMELGRKVWNLDRAIWVLQGRHRDMEVFTDYNYEVGAAPGYTTYEMPYVMPVNENGVWSYKAVSGRKLDRQKVEDWKTKFFTLEKWDTKTGWPTRATLEELGLKHVADELEQNEKLGV